MIWFSSDHHFDHANIIKYDNRPFSSVDEMNEEMVKRWNLRVLPSDIIYYLGDFSLNRAALRFVKRLNGIKFLIPGNHDRCHPVHQNWEKERGAYIVAGFADILPVSELIGIGKHFIRLCHMPYRNENEFDVRYADIRPHDDGKWLLHGHVHTAWKVHGKMINVGACQWDYFPVSDLTIRELIEGAAD
jgi:calcineurin-like phosphoesterase family protein